MEDQKIIKLLWLRAESAIEALAKKFGKRLMSIAMNIPGLHQDAEETVNDTYLAVWNMALFSCGWKTIPLCSSSCG